MITAADEQLHDPGDGVAERDSYYFNWADAEGRSFGLARVGLDAATGTADGIVVTMRDGRAEYVYPRVGVSVPAATDGAGLPVEFGLRVGDLCLSMREPLHRWHIGLTGKNEIALTWTATSLPCGARGRFEQPGVVKGRMRINGVEHAVDGRGRRERSWGAGDRDTAAGWDWISAQFGDDLAISVGSHGGHLLIAGEHRPVTEFAVEYAWAGATHIPRAATITVRDATGEPHQIRASALAQFPLYKGGLFIQETHAQFDWRVGGERRTGVGVVEHAWHCNPLRLLERLPRLAPLITLAAKEKLS